MKILRLFLNIPFVAANGIAVVLWITSAYSDHISPNNICQSLFHALLDLPNRMAISTDESIGGSAMLGTCQALLSLPFQQRDPPREHIESANL